MSQEKKPSNTDKVKIKSKKVKRIAHYQRSELIKANDQVASQFVSFFENLIQTNSSLLYHPNQR